MFWSYLDEIKPGKISTRQGAFCLLFSIVFMTAVKGQSPIATRYFLHFLKESGKFMPRKSVLVIVHNFISLVTYLDNTV